MRAIDRLYQYIQQKDLTAYAFERACGIANGYLRKQFNGGGTIGSEILEKISNQYRDLSLIWLITGTGLMLLSSSNNTPPSQQLEEQQQAYPSQEQLIARLKERIAALEGALADKEKIIRLLETQRLNNNNSY